MGAAVLADDPVVVWRPRSKPQAALISCPVFEIFFGGARGSLKTDSVLGDWINHANIYGRDATGLMLRRTRLELLETYERAKTIYRPLGFKFNDSAPMIATSPNDARLRFSYLDRDADAEAYQGHSYTRVYIEEIGNFPNSAPVLKMMATLRSAAGVPVGFRATGNPGGPGHQWVKARYIDANPKGWVVQRFEYKNPFDGKIVMRDRVFIPGKITDHTLLGPEYIANLQMSGSEQLVRAWLEGDWDIVIGAYFDCWRADKHVIRPFKLEPHWTRFRSFDWGSARPFSVGWWTILSEDFEHPDGFVLPKNAMVRYREWYGCTEPNVGLKLPAEAVAEGIIAREADDPKDHEGRQIHYGVADPSIFAQDGGPSIAERHLKTGIMWRRADNKRVAEKGRMGGWDQVRGRMIGEGDKPGDKPMIYCFSTCQDSIRTIPALQHDEARPEDVDTDSEDHAGDEWRYACMSRPWARPMPKSEPVRWQPTINEMIAERTRARKQQEY